MKVLSGKLLFIFCCSSGLGITTVPSSGHKTQCTLLLKIKNTWLQILLKNKQINKLQSIQKYFLDKHIFYCVSAFALFLWCKNIWTEAWVRCHRDILPGICCDGGAGRQWRRWKRTLQPEQQHSTGWRRCGHHLQLRWGPCLSHASSKSSLKIVEIYGVVHNCIKH